MNDISLNSNRESKETWGTSLAIGWRKLTSFDKAWAWGVLVWIGVSLLGLLIFLSAETSLVAYLQKTGFSIQESESIFAASMWEIMIYLALLMIGLILVTFILGKRLKPQRATILCWVILVICMLDFYRANKPWTVFYNYQTRLQKDDMIEYLISQPKTERVSIVPGKDEYSQALMQLYSVEWMQHEFPHYNIHTLQSWMEPRKGTDKIIFEGMFSTNMLRYWELTGVKHLIGAKGYAEALNTSLDSEKKRFSEEFIFTMNPVEAPRHLLAKQDQEGPFSIIRFEGAIPRLALYQNWEVVPTDNEVFTRLTDPEFDPTQTVLISQDSIPEGDSGICTDWRSGLVGYCCSDSLLPAGNGGSYSHLPPCRSFGGFPGGCAYQSRQAAAFQAQLCVDERSGFDCRCRFAGICISHSTGSRGAAVDQP